MNRTEGATIGQEAEPQTRETFKLSRLLEFFSENELTKQMGYTMGLWLLAILKELIDNALDHCEEIGRLPDIEVTVTENSLSVRDNGNGIPASTIEGMLDFGSRFSSREATRCPTRGQQGNAGKCLFAMPFVLNGGKLGRTVIESRGIRHEVTVTVDPIAQQPVIMHVPSEQKVQIGTFAEVHFDKYPRELDAAENARFVLLCRQYAALNPHLSLTLISPEGRREWPRTAEVCTKWTAAENDPPAWHDEESITRLASACISRDRDLGENRTVSDFLRGRPGFAGLKRSDAIGKVTDEAGLVGEKLTALVNCDGLDKDKVKELLTAMQKHGTNPKPEKLGCVGKGHVTAALQRFGAGEVKYKKFVGIDSRGLPVVVEAAFGELKSGQIIITGCNFSPSIEQPIVRMLDSLLSEQMFQEDSAAVVFLHIATVKPPFQDRGKRVLWVGDNPIVTQAINETVCAVTSDYRRQRKKEERDASAKERREERAAKKARKSNHTLRDAILRTLAEAHDKVSFGKTCRFDDRELYYKARPLIQQFTEETLTQKYFDRVIDEWEEENEPLWGRDRSPRGFLLEPHTRIRIPLGTKEVEDYEIPADLYDVIIYVEKKGLLSKFEFGQIGEKYDCAIICAEGYAVKAAKALLAAAQRGHKMTVLCFHDADPYGYNIARTLSRNTGAHKFNIKVIDAGLHIQEALKLGLETEKFTRTKAFPRDLHLSEIDKEYFTGDATSVTKRNGELGTAYINCRRIELNALSSDPPAFVRWIESTLKEHGVAQKLVPSKKVIAARARARKEAYLRQRIQQELENRFDVGAKVQLVMSKLLLRVNVDNAADVVGKWAKKVKPEPWTKCVEDLVSGAVAKLEKVIIREVGEVMEGE